MYVCMYTVRKKQRIKQRQGRKGEITNMYDGTDNELEQKDFDVGSDGGADNGDREWIRARK